ncbi:MAG: replication protein [Bacilli bacterium]|nr:replication protein [Bacilli bacterium]
MQKGRNWAFVVYPDSLPSDYEEIIINTGLPMAFSPLHDKDVNPTGESKKPHYHVICYYENTTTFKNVKENVTTLLNGTIPIKLESMVGMYRYHLHLDNPEKFQYDDRFRTFYNGFDVSKVDSLSYTEVSKTLRDIQQFIIDNSILEYSDLLDILNDNELFIMWNVAKDHTLFLKSYIDSRRFKTRQELVSKKNI